MKKLSKASLINRLGNLYGHLTKLESEYDYQEEMLQISKGYKEVHKHLVKIDELRALMSKMEEEIEETKDLLLKETDKGAVK